MTYSHLFAVAVLLCLSTSTLGQFNRDQFASLQALNCPEPLITLHVFSGTPNPTWAITLKQLSTIKALTHDILFKHENSSLFSKPSTRVMGYQGFTISCSADKYVFVHGLSPVEKILLRAGRRHLSTPIIHHVQNHLGEVLSELNDVTPGNADCNHVPIKGPDTVPKYDPNTDDNGCFITKQTENNCYAYGSDIVTNTFPQPGRGSGKKWTMNTCEDMGNASIRDGLVYNGTKLPTGAPEQGHFVALLIWPQTNFHWIRMDANGYWSHKPGGTPVRNKDNRNLPITDPSKSDFSPWTQFCAYYVAQPSKLQIN